MDDPYSYPGTDVLRNKLDLRDAAQLRQFEGAATSIRGMELMAQPIKGSFDLAHLQKIHGHLFGDVYDWAGQTRSVVISKGSTTFARPEYIEGEGKRLAKSLASENHLQGLERGTFVERMAEHYGDWNALHPFREGNGRSTREFFRQVADRAGFDFAADRVAANRDEWAFASAMSFVGRNAKLVEMLDASVRHGRAVAFERADPAQAQTRYPELKDAYEALSIVQSMTALRYAEQPDVHAAVNAQAKEAIVRRLDAGLVPSVSPELRRSANELFAGDRPAPSAASVEPLLARATSEIER